MNLNDLSKEITFFSTGPVRREVFQPIEVEAKKRGYETKYTSDHSEKAEIGFYNEHTYRINQINSELSAITVHSLDCLYGENHWITEPWSRFDIGFVPGEYTAKKWKNCSWYPKARPNMGVYRTGWTKSDPIGTQQFNKEVNKIKDEINLFEGKTALFAPISATDQKFYDFINNCGCFDNLLIKTHPSYDTNLPDVKEDNITILPPETGIFKSSALADVLVSDKSSVLQESILTETVPVSVVDWVSGFSKNKSIDSRIPDFAIKTKREQLNNTLHSVIKNYDTHVDQINHVRDEHFDNIGNSAAVTMDIIDEIVAYGCPQQQPIESDYSIIARTYGVFRETIADYIPYEMKKHLHKYL